MPHRLIKAGFNSDLRAINRDLPIDDNRISDFLKIYIIYNTKYADVFSDKNYAKLTGGLTVGELFGKYLYSDKMAEIPSEDIIYNDYLNLWN